MRPFTFRSHHTHLSRHMSLVSGQSFSLTCLILPSVGLSSLSSVCPLSCARPSWECDFDPDHGFPVQFNISPQDIVMQWWSWECISATGAVQGHYNFYFSMTGCNFIVPCPNTHSPRYSPRFLPLHLSVVRRGSVELEHLS